MTTVWYLGALLVGIFLFWDYAILYPLKLLVVFFHESSHALATILTGGKVNEMVLLAEQGGHVSSLGGNRFVTLSAGYLGSLVWGMLIYMAASLTRMDRLAMLILGVSVGVITVVFASNLFAILFGFAVCLAMSLSGRFLSHNANDFFLRLIGLTSMMYAVIDIYSDTISRSHLRSDARMLAEEFGGGTALWGGLWIALSLVAIFACLRWSVRRNKIQTTT